MRKLFSFIGISAFLALGCGPALASLGSNTASIEADRVAMQAPSVKQTAASSYTTHEYTLPSGTVVREYVSMMGVVFGVSWNGPFIPDLQQLLGAENFAAFSAAVREQSERGPQVIRQGSLVVRSFGRMRAFNGSAYLTDKLPSGVKPDDVQ